MTAEGGIKSALYPMIFKRKSFHSFRGAGNEKLDARELADIESAWRTFSPLCPNIRTAVRIVPAGEVRFTRGAEYCVLLYSEEGENSLANIGYLGEQLDLYLVSRDIATLWFGIGKPDEKSFDGLTFVIMIAIRKTADPSLFRKDMFASKRKPLDEIWSGDTLGAAEIARFSPSACNSQPWYVKNEGGELTVFRYKRPLWRGIMPASLVSYYNRIDVGIFLCILEICMAEKGICCERELFADPGGAAEYTKAAVYRIRRRESDCSTVTP